MFTIKETMKLDDIKSTNALTLLHSQCYINFFTIICSQISLHVPNDNVLCLNKIRCVDIPKIIIVS